MGIFEMRVEASDSWTPIRFPSDMPMSLLESMGSWKNSCMRNYVALMKAAEEFDRSADTSGSPPVYPCKCRH